MSRRVPILAAFATALLGSAALLAWHDVLPGGWRLRGWVLGPEGRAERVRERHAAERMESFRAERGSLPADAIVFLGSSTIERFPLAELFPGVPCVDRGVNGDTAADLYARLDESLAGVDAAGFVVNVGANDLRREGAVAAVVRDRVEDVLDALAERSPDAPITLVGLFPGCDADAAEIEETELTNLVLSRAATKRGAAFVPVARAPLVGENRRLAPDHSADCHHLNERGYRRLAEWIRERGAVGRLLAERTR